MGGVMVRLVDVPPAIQATSASVPMRHFLPPLVLHQPGFSCRWGGLGKGDGTGPDIRSLLARSGEVLAGRLGDRTYRHDSKAALALAQELKPLLGRAVCWCRGHRLALARQWCGRDQRRLGRLVDGFR